MSNTNKPTTAAACTPEVIAAWKSKYPKGIWELKVEDQELGEEEAPDPDKPHKTIKVKKYSYKTGFVQKPSREQMKYALTMMGQGGEMAMMEAVLEEIWLGGDEELLTDDDFFYGAIMQLKPLLDIKGGELKKVLNEASGKQKDNWIGYIDTMFAYYLPGVDASKLSDERWAEMYKQLLEIRKQEAKQNA